MSYSRYPTPLRYPGGKQRFFSYFQSLILLNQLKGCCYVEPFAGGAGLGLALLTRDLVGRIHLNDLDRSVYAFWHSVKHRNNELCKRLRSTRISIAEWDRQKVVQRQKKRASLFDLGFSTMFLNRTNRSGILRGGMIGGRKQDGEWTIGARFNKDGLIARLQHLSELSDSISISNRDSLEVSDLTFESDQPCLIYIDPPYFEKASRLYMNHFAFEDHKRLANKVKKITKSKAVVTYDATDEILRLYRKFTRRYIALAHTASTYRVGKEVMFFSDNLRIPQFGRRI